MNILITGSLGHIGSFFLKKITRNRKVKKIYIIDNNKSEKINILFNYKSKNKIFFRLGDLTIKKSLNNIKNIKTVIHFASLTNAEESVKFKKEISTNNFLSFLNIVNFCINNKSNLIHISSTSVYGSQDAIVDEKCKQLKPQSPYAEIKLKEEQYLKKLKDKLKFVTLRFATIAGVSDGMRFHTAVNKFCHNAIMNKPITVWKTAMNQYRPYLSLNDAYKAILFILKKNLFDRSIYNIVTTNLTVGQILKKIKKIKKNIKIKYTNSEIMNQLSYHVLSNKIKNKGLNLGESIDKDIEDTFKIFKSIKNY
jgi:nucleoside-diphosphate-sugar epimerase